METSKNLETMNVAELIRNGKVRTRQDIVKELSMRSSSVSEIVGRLIDIGLVEESLIKSDGRGRPAYALRFNNQRFGAIFVNIVDRTIRAQIADMNFQTYGETSCKPPENVDNEALLALIRKIVEDAESRIPPGIEIKLLVFSISGLLDAEQGVWCVSSRWPKMKDLKLAEAFADKPYALHMMRNLDAELSGICSELPDFKRDNALLIHWGQGIGASFSANGQVINKERGRFCEIGHWSLGNRQNKPCNCGNRDCLETVAALWAIGTSLNDEFGGIPLDETGLAEALGQRDVSVSPTLNAALAEVVRLTVNLCRVLFPQEIFLSGPFVQNPEIFRKFVEVTAEAPLIGSIDQVKISVCRNSESYELRGALQDQFFALRLDYVSSALSAVATNS